MFRGTHLTRLDEKGRLKMPAEFKREIDENYSAQFYITSWDGKSAKVYPMQAWEEIERKLAALPEMHKTKRSSWSAPATTDRRWSSMGKAGC